MVLIYRTSSVKNAQSVERRLIDTHWEYIDNERGGGAGNLGWPPYYVYLVRTR